MKNNIRLNKYLALCGVGSRRSSEKYILEGRVKINGKVVDKIGTVVNSDDIVELDDKRLNIIEEKVYIVLNKPINSVCTKRDYSNRKTIYDIVNTNVPNIFSVGRLDYKTSGLLILTNDGEFANKLMHPSNSLIKEYVVKVKDISISKEKFENLSKDFKNGINIDGITYQACDLKREGKNIIRVYLIEGKKREIRIVFKYFNIEIEKLCRTKIGGLDLEKLFLKPGEYRFFSKHRLEKLIYVKDY